MSGLEDIGEKAVAFVNARAARMAARRKRNRAAREYQEEESAVSDDSEHPKGYTDAFLAATAVEQAAYDAALAAEKSARQRLYVAVRKHNKTAGEQA